MSSYKETRKERLNVVVSGEAYAWSARRDTAVPPVTESREVGDALSRLARGDGPWPLGLDGGAVISQHVRLRGDE